MTNPSKITLVLAMVLALLVLVRIVPAFVSNSLFSTDVWPLYRSTKVLLNKPWIHIWEDGFFDGYNNRWPGVILSTTIYSMVTGFSPETVYMYAYTMALGYGFLLLFYTITRRFFDTCSSILCILVMGFLPSFLVFTSSPLKEVYAYPMFFSIILLVVRSFASYSVKMRDFLLLLILALGMVLSHHLATYMLIGSLFGILYVSLVYYLRGKTVSIILPASRILLVVILIAGIFAGYYIVYGGAGLRLDLPHNCVLIYLFYAFVIYGGFLVFAGSSRSFILTLSPLLLLIVYTLFFAHTLDVLPGINISGKLVFWYVLPVVMSLPLVKGIDCVPIKVLLAGVGLFIVLNTVYVTFGFTLFSSIFHRFADYIVVIASILVAYSWCCGSLLKRVFVILIVVLVFLSGGLVLANIVRYNNDVSYYWFYPEYEVLGFDTILAYADNDLTVIGDSKIHFYAIMVRDVYSEPVLKMLFLNEKPRYDYLFILYRGNYRIGYAFGLNVYHVAHLFDQRIYNRLYDNTYVQGYIYGVKK